MKNLVLALTIAIASVSLAAVYETETADVHINVPGKPLFFPSAKITYYENGIVTVRTNTGFIYKTHIVNVVIVKRW